MKNPVSYFSDLHDPRIDRTKAHLLEDIIFIAIQGLIHHSDRGVQYCCKEYVELLKTNNIRISMTENDDPYENALAERVNGILKDEWLDLEQFNSFEQAKECIGQVVKIYNEIRPHLSCGMKTPNQKHNSK